VGRRQRPDDEPRPVAETADPGGEESPQPPLDDITVDGTADRPRDDHPRSRRQGAAGVGVSEQVDDETPRPAPGAAPHHVVEVLRAT
jgi:hypothetical protein